MSGYCPDCGNTLCVCDDRLFGGHGIEFDPDERAGGTSARDDYPLLADPYGSTRYPTGHQSQCRDALDEIDRLRSFRDAVLAIEEKSGTHPSGPADDPDWITYCDAANRGWNTLRMKLHALATPVQPDRRPEP
jgi:hypothetical protein